MNYPDALGQAPTALQAFGSGPRNAFNWPKFGQNFMQNLGSMRLPQQQIPSALGMNMSQFNRQMQAPQLGMLEQPRMQQYLRALRG